MKARWAGSSWPSAHSGGMVEAQGRALPGMLAEAEDCAPLQGVSRGGADGLGGGSGPRATFSPGLPLLQGCPSHMACRMPSRERGFRMSLGGVWALLTWRGAEAPEEEEPTTARLHAGVGTANHGGLGVPWGAVAPDLTTVPSARPSRDCGLGLGAGGSLEPGLLLGLG